MHINTTTMKLLYSQIKEYIPDYSISVEETCKALTMIGYMQDSLEKVTYQEKSDYVISVEVRHDRPDCLSVLGLCRELSAYFKLTSTKPESKILTDKDTTQRSKLPIIISAENHITRVLAIAMNNIQVKPSPLWLQEYLALYDIRSINTLVDISNYVMLLTGHPSHIFDRDKLSGTLQWIMNKGSFKEIVTLDGSAVALTDNSLIIRDDTDVLALAGMVGGDRARIGDSTKNILLEIAVYDYALIKQNSRELDIVTEASRRLEKKLDPNGIDYPFSLLVELITRYCGGTLDSEAFEYYPSPYIPKPIQFQAEKASLYSGITIPTDESLAILKRLGYSIQANNTALPPVDRMDVEGAEDVIGDIIRLYGYGHIPTDETPQITITKDITPKSIIFAEKIRDILTTLGYDEALTWTMTTEKANLETKYEEAMNIVTENAVNAEVPALRQTITTGLLKQLGQYRKQNVQHIHLFEIGKVFSSNKGAYIENNNLGILLYSQENCSENLQTLQSDIEKLLYGSGIGSLKYRESLIAPQIANPLSCWDIYAEGTDTAIGILYKVHNKEDKASLYIFECTIEKVIQKIEENTDRATKELTGKLIELDATIETGKATPSIDTLLGEIRTKLPAEHIWSIEIADTYMPYTKRENTRYTIRITYTGFEDREARKTHAGIFGEVSNIFAGRIVSLQQHPNADRLRIATIDLANDTARTIVCGAPNIYVNMIVPVSLPGSIVYADGSPMTIQKTSLRGVTSEGMLCSEKELSLSNNHDGILDLTKEMNIEVGDRIDGILAEKLLEK